MLTNITKTQIANFYKCDENILCILVKISNILLHRCVKLQKTVINLGSAKVFAYVSLKFKKKEKLKIRLSIKG